MELGDGKRKTLMLLDEYSSGGVLTLDEDISAKMNDFFDLAQKDMAAYKKILRSETIELDGSDFVELPENFKSIYRTWKNDRIRKPYTIREGKLYTKGDTGIITLEYFAYPHTITPDTPDDYEFEVSDDAAQCLPFYVAAQQLITDLVVNYEDFWNMYLAHKGSLDTSIPGSGNATVRQTLWR